MILRQVCKASPPGHLNAIEADELEVFHREIALDELLRIIGPDFFGQAPQACR